MRTIILCMCLVACAANSTVDYSPDAGIDPDNQEVCPLADDLPPCWQACRGAQEVAPWYVDGTYCWSYCLPSYQQCRAIPEDEATQNAPRIVQ